MFHYTATVTHYPQRSGSCCPMRRGLHHFRDKQCHCVWRRRIKNKIESNKKYIYRKKKPRNTGGKELTLVGGLTHQARLAHTRVTVTSLWIAMDTHTSTALFPFAQANTYRERLLIKGLWGEGRGGICSRQSQCQQGGGPVPSFASSSLGPVLLSWGQASEAGVWGRTPGRQDVMNVMFSGTENQSRWRQQRCPLYTV